MRAIVADGTGGMDGLGTTEIAAPGALGPGQIRIAMRAASLNYRDLLALSAAPAGFIPCSDGAGLVTEIAADVRRVALGAHVALTISPGWIGGEWRPSQGGTLRSGNLPGVMQDEMVVHESEVVEFPPHLDFLEAATLPCAALTAWSALRSARPMLPGATVLLEGAGGVSVFALQFAKLFGARVIMTTSGDARGQRLRALGADEVVNYRSEPAWDAAVRLLTGGRGVDLAVDVGGADTIDRALAATRMGGRLAVVGLLSGEPRITTSMMSKLVTVAPVMAGSRNDFEDMNRAVDYHKVRPVIDRVFDFGDFSQALGLLKSGTHFGKIAIAF